VHPTLERLRGTVGVWTVTHESLPPTRVGEVAERLESAGFPIMWIPEAWGREAMTSAQLLLGSCDRLAVATGIASIYARDAMATASAARTLSAQSSGRFVLGLGVSHRPLVERGRGGVYEPPLRAMAAYLDALGAAPVLSAEHDEVVPVVLAALGPRMLSLAATRTDGALTYLVTPAHTASARETLGSEAFLGVELSVVLGEDRDEFLRRAHEHLNVYTGLENYRASWARLGYDDTDWVRGGSERLCDDLVVHGDVDVVREAARAHLDAGADHVCLQVLGSTLNEVPFAQWDELGHGIASR
jgi:probable F420-dependent oxidoreductase